MAAASNSVLDSAIPFNAIRRNIMIGSALAFLLMFTDVDASEFKFFEVKIGAGTLLAVLAGFLGYYLVIFVVRLLLLFIAEWVDTRANREQRRREADMEVKEGRRTPIHLQSPIFRALYRIPNLVTAYVVLFEFLLPMVFGILMLGQLLERVNITPYIAAVFPS